MIEIGSFVGTYEIKEMEKGYCYAERPKKLNCSDYVVWNVDCNKKGVNTGRYYESKNAAIKKYQELISNSEYIF